MLDSYQPQKKGFWWILEKFIYLLLETQRQSHVIWICRIKHVYEQLTGFKNIFLFCDLWWFDLAGVICTFTSSQLPRKQRQPATVGSQLANMGTEMTPGDFRNA